MVCKCFVFTGQLSSYVRHTVTKAALSVGLVLAGQDGKLIAIRISPGLADNNRAYYRRIKL